MIRMYVCVCVTVCVCVCVCVSLCVTVCVCVWVQASRPSTACASALVATRFWAVHMIRCVRCTQERWDHFFKYYTIYIHIIFKKMISTFLFINRLHNLTFFFGGEQTARMFSVSSGKEQFCIDLYTGPVLSASFTTDCPHVITGSFFLKKNRSV